ncbi:Microtubule-actin cross-linking factor 1, isoforms 1/2/3/5 [Papilio machaon]|uniref:Microtubule-actin cross-linking factor 1, isoforms 1/2/3/5 n=1 Tax=Papilio machaon TaxID=76193 RepID=A0A0N0PC68_PAPMA|nr:Microtubule-actin cross-linking factor 1, isoforms 1/2/3/5 [Papilio machaon]
MEHCRKYSKAQESFLPWLSDTEERLLKLPPTTFTKKEVERQLRELQQIRNDIWKRSGEFENNKTLGETFISACDVDQEVVRNQIDSMKERWDRINNEVLQHVEFLESTLRKLGEFLERVRGVEAPLQRCEERLEAASSAPPHAAHDAVARVADQLHALRAPLQVEGLRKQLGKLDERARSKEQDLDDTLSKLEAFYKAYDAVMEDVQEVT